MHKHVLLDHYSILSGSNLQALATCRRSRRAETMCQWWCHGHCWSLQLWSSVAIIALCQSLQHPVGILQALVASKRSCRAETMCHWWRCRGSWSRPSCQKQTRSESSGAQTHARPIPHKHDTCRPRMTASQQGNVGSKDLMECQRFGLHYVQPSKDNISERFPNVMQQLAVRPLHPLVGVVDEHAVCEGRCSHHLQLNSLSRHLSIPNISSELSMCLCQP